MTRKRINISVDESQYEKLTRIKEAWGFRNVCELTTALLNVVTQYIDAAEERHGKDLGEAGDEITAMFDDLGAWEETPATIVPPARRRKDNYED